MSQDYLLFFSSASDGKPILGCDSEPSFFSICLLATFFYFFMASTVFRTASFLNLSGMLPSLSFSRYETPFLFMSMPMNRTSWISLILTLALSDRLINSDLAFSSYGLVPYTLITTTSLRIKWVEFASQHANIPSITTVESVSASSSDLELRLMFSFAGYFLIILASCPTQWMKKKVRITFWCVFSSLGISLSYASH